MSYSDKVQEHTSAVKAAEERLCRIVAYRDKGGERRIIITADADTDTRSDIQALADQHFPMGTIMRALETYARKDLEAAKSALLDFMKATAK